MERVKVAAVLAAPVWLEREATIDKVIALTEQAAAAGAGLVAFPEAFVLGYPDWVWRTRPWDQHATDLYARLLEQAVVVGSPATTALADAAGRLGVWLSVGVEELDTSSTTIYNTLLHFAPDSTLAARHHKLMPTGEERLVWGNGDGSTLTTLDTPFGRLAGLICWENYMPLARAALYSQGIDIYLAPTWDNSDVWEPTLRHIAKEGRVYVVGVTACIRGADVPTDLPPCLPSSSETDRSLSKGSTAIIGPDGDMLARPLIAEAGFVSADLDADRRTRRAPTVRPRRPLQPQRHPAPDGQHDGQPRGGLPPTGSVGLEWAPELLGQRVVSEQSRVTAPLCVRLW